MIRELRLCGECDGEDEIETKGSAEIGEWLDYCPSCRAIEGKIRLAHWDTEKEEMTK